jgi:ABC-type Fe3+-hydroxamate transport system substrate-binding protein
MAVKANPATAAERWKTGFAGSSTKYKEGIESVKTSPGQLAAAQRPLYETNVIAAAPTWAAKMAAMPLAGWKASATNVGAARLATGAEKGAPKVSAFMSNFLPKLSQVVDSLPARGSFEQNLARFATYAQNLHAQKGTF